MPTLADVVRHLETLGELLGAGLVLLLIGALYVGVVALLTRRFYGPSTARAAWMGAAWGITTAVAGVTLLFIVTVFGKPLLPDGTRITDLAPLYFAVLLALLLGSVVVACHMAARDTPAGARGPKARWTASLAVLVFLALVYPQLEFVSSCFVGEPFLFTRTCN